MNLLRASGLDGINGKCGVHEIFRDDIPMLARENFFLSRSSHMHILDFECQPTSLIVGLKIKSDGVKVMSSIIIFEKKDVSRYLVTIP